MAHQRHGELNTPGQVPIGPDRATRKPASSKTTWTVRRPRNIAPTAFPLRKYDIMWGADNGDIHDASIIAPALTFFELAFNAFARGALITTDRGQVAIEDLLPGDMIETVGGECLPVSWIGSMQLDIKGKRFDDAPPEGLIRLMADSFGFSRPTHDLMLGAGARYMYRTEALKAYLGTAMALAPVAGLVDGHSAIDVKPISSVRTYHICLPQHRLIYVNGVELESYHPGAAAAGQLLGDLRRKFMELFPHLGELGDFGALAHPRLSLGDLRALNAA